MALVTDLSTFVSYVVTQVKKSNRSVLQKSQY